MKEMTMRQIVVVMALLAVCSVPAQAARHGSRKIVHHAIGAEHHALHRAKSAPGEPPSSPGRTLPYDAFRA
jgi:hypothetical protein